MSLTIKEAKAHRCSDDRCKHWHHTCRRCELHTGLFSFNRKSGLCDECYKKYQEWYSDTIRGPALSTWRGEKKAGGDPDWTPYLLGAAYAEWIKQAPRKNRRVIDISKEYEE